MSTLIHKIAISVKTTNVARATCSLFFEKFKKTHFIVLKNVKLIADMDNVEIYKHAKFQLEIPYKFQNVKIYQILSFLWSLEYKEFRIETLHLNIVRVWN
jgi:hypothetical protein